jgi:hypothetical protein
MPVRLYAVLRLRPRARPTLPRGLQGERLKILKHAGYSLAVADTRAVLEPAVDNLLEFDRVIRALAALSEAILPARFGSVSPSAASLKSEIAERAAALATALDNVTGRVQMKIRLSTTEDSLRSSSGSSVVKSSRATGAAYLHNRAAVWRSPALTKVRKALGALVHDERVEAGASGTSVYHLIERGDVEEYLDRLTRFRASGPFPPYAFVPGIDHAFWRGYDDEKSQPADAGSPRPRTHRRSPRNAGR